MNIKYSFFFVVFLSVCFPGLSQTPEVTKAVGQIMNNIKSNTIVAVNSDIIYKPSNAEISTKALAPYFKDSLYQVRSKAYNILAIVGRKSENEAVRRKSVALLLEGCKDKEASVSGECSKSLQQFVPKDFDERSRKEISSLLSIKTPYLNNVAQLAGFIGEKTYEPILLQLLTEPNLGKRDKWAIQISLARVGNSQYLNKVVTRIRSLPVNDDVILEGGPALTYIRQKESVDYLFEIIMSDNKSCESANPDSNENILCAYRAMEYVAPIVIGFPLKLDASGDLDVKDYKQALVEARNWYTQNKHTYLLIKDVF